MDAKTRLGWIRLYERLGDAGLVCRRCGISRPTLRKWWRRYQVEGIDGLEERSRRPRRAAGQKIFAEQEALILEVRRRRQLGIKQLRSELLRDHGLRLSLDTLHRVLTKHGEHRLKRPRLPRKGTKQYSRPVPGDRVQVDVCKIAPAAYRYTAIDDCSRLMIVRGGKFWGFIAGAAQPAHSVFSTAFWRKCHFQSNDFKPIEGSNSSLKPYSVD
jgi:transposase